MNRQIVLMIVVFMVALGSGVVVGTTLRKPAQQQPNHDRSFLANELSLNTEQQGKIREIWSEALRRDGLDRRREMQKQRDEAVIALLSPEQKKQYDALQEEFERQMAEMAKARELTFQKAVERTRSVLDDKQRARYDELLKRGALGPPRGRHGPATSSTPGGSGRPWGEGRGVPGGSGLLPPPIPSDGNRRPVSK